MTMLCLCREEHDLKMIPAYAEAFRSHSVDFFCVNDSLAHLAKARQTRLAPARNWSVPRARLVALDFYASRGLTSCAAAQLRKIAGHGVQETIGGGIASFTFLDQVLHPMIFCAALPRDAARLTLTA
jgi:hypothetical protein